MARRILIVLGDDDDGDDDDEATQESERASERSKLSVWGHSFVGVRIRVRVH